MSYYSSASLLDPYCIGGSRYSTTRDLGDTLLDRRDSAYSSAYNSSYGISSRSKPSAYDRYVSYLADELTSTGTSSRRSSYLSSYNTSYNDDFKLPPLSTSRRYLTDTYTSTYKGNTSSTSRPLITSAPAFDKYGKELSNYDRWKLQHGEATSDIRPSRTRRSTLTEESSVVRSDRETSATPLSSVARESSSSLTSMAYEQKEISPVYTSKYFGSTSGGKSYDSSSLISTHSRPTTTRYVHSFPASVRSKLSTFDVQDVKGDGGCYYRCLSLYFTGSEENYNKYRREVMNYIRDNLDSYTSMIKSEVGYSSINDYLSRKFRTDRQEFAETTEIIASCCLYDINIHVLALVPGRHTWEWLHFDPSIGSGKPSYTTKNIYLYNQGSVHFMLCSPK